MEFHVKQHWAGQLEALLRYGLMSVNSFVINFGLTFSLHEFLALPEELAFAIGLITMLVINFVGFRYYVFKASAETAPQQMMRFFLTALGFRSSEYLTFMLVHTIMGVDYRVAVVGILALSTIAKFFCYRLLVFRT